MKKDISIIIPIYNEEESLAQLMDNLQEFKKGFSKGIEIIFVDDGSTDASFEVLKILKSKAKDKDITIIKFKKNFGQTAALAAGFKLAEGEIVVTLDADLQNDPRDINLLVSEIEKGWDIVSGWRRKRKDPFFSRRIPSYLANNIISWYTGVKLHDYGCTLKAYRRELLKDLSLYGELHRFIPALLSWSGATIKEIPVNHFPRKFGKSKYGILRTISVILDLLTVKFLLVSSKGPMQIFGRMGLGCLLFGFVSGMAALFMKLVGNMDLTGNPITYLCVLFFIVSMQFISIGLLGEISMRIYSKSYGNDIYAIKEVIR